MISKETTTDLVNELNAWQARFNISDKIVEALLKKLGEVDGNQSFKSSIWLLFCEFKGMLDKEKEMVMRAKAGIQLPTKRKDKS